MRDNLLDTLLEKSIVLSFSNIGFALRRCSWRAADLDVGLTGRNAVVTGGSAGIGYATAEGLAVLGTSVWLLVRDLAAGDQARQTIIERTGNPAVHVLQADLSSLKSVREVSDALLKAAAAIHVLIHNAGVLPNRRQRSPDGIELALATNVIGPFALTLHLLPGLRAGAPSRVIWVSSGGMYTQGLHLEDWQTDQGEYRGAVVYARNKRAQVVLTELLAERLADHGIAVNAMHPGWVDTPGLRRSLPRFHRLMQPLLRSPLQGTDTILWLAAAQEPKHISGKFWHDRRPRSTHLLRDTRPSPAERQMLWELCGSLSGLGVSLS